MAEMKTAAYICSGCGIGERVSTAQMAKIAQKEGKMALVREHAFLCSEEGVQQVRADIAGEGVTHLAVQRARVGKDADLKTLGVAFGASLARAEVAALHGVVEEAPD
mgnify:CR=1 FL=1